MNSPEITNTSEFSEFIENSTTTKVDGCSSGPYAPGSDIYFYGLLVIIPFGLIGNILSICVFFTSEMLRRTTTGQYLIALAVADSSVLIGDAIRWLATRRHNTPYYYIPQYLGLNFFDYSNAGCSITNFVRYGGNLCSVWLTIAISVERLFAVALPLKIGHLSTTKRTRIIIACIGIVSFVLGSFPFWTVHAGTQRKCGVDVPHCKIYDNAYYTWNTAVVKFCTLLIPGILIVIITVAIIALLYRARNKRKAQLNASQRKQRAGIARLEVSMDTQLTLMLVAVCVSTIALRAPYTIAYYFRASSWKQFDPGSDVQRFVAYRVTDMVNTVNYAINFVLYCLCGSSFRGEARKIFCRAKTNKCSSPVTDKICLTDVKKKSAGSISRAQQNR